MSNSMKELFNVNVEHQDYQSENKLLVALVYSENYKNGLFHNYTELLIKFREYLEDKGFNLSNVDVFMMDDERILGSSINFDKVYIEKDVAIEIQNEVKDCYKKAEIITLI